jgi:hypothetical protein
VSTSRRRPSRSSTRGRFSRRRRERSPRRATPPVFPCRSSGLVVRKRVPR